MADLFKGNPFLRPLCRQKRKLGLPTACRMGITDKNIFIPILFMVKLFPKLCTVVASAELGGKGKHKDIFCLGHIAFPVSFRGWTGGLGAFW